MSDYKYEQPSWYIISNCFSLCPQDQFVYLLCQGAASNASLHCLSAEGAASQRNPPHSPNPTTFHIQLSSSPGKRNSPDPFHFTSRFHHCKRLPTTPVPEMYLIGSCNQQELSRRMKSKRCNRIVAICEPALTSTLSEESRITSSLSQSLRSLGFHVCATSSRLCLEHGSDMLSWQKQQLLSYEVTCHVLNITTCNNDHRCIFVGKCVSSSL